MVILKKLGGFEKESSTSNQSKISGFVKLEKIGQETLDLQKSSDYKIKTKINLKIPSKPSAKQFDLNSSENQSATAIRQIKVSAQALSSQQVSEIQEITSVSEENQNGLNIDSLLEELEKKTSVITNDSDGTFMELFSFAGSSPKISKLSYKSFNVDRLYSKVDSLKNQSDQGDVLNLEALSISDIPTIIPIKDDVVDISKHVDSIMSVAEDRLTPEKEKQEIKAPSFVVSAEKIILNPAIKEKIKVIDKTPRKEILKIKDDYDMVPVKQIPPLTEETVKEKLDKSKSVFDYILPADADLYKKKGYIKYTPVSIGVLTSDFDKKQIQFPNIVYTSKIKELVDDLNNINESYAIDEFTYVTISSKKDRGIFYSLIQPELKPEQERIFTEIKNALYDSIDKNYNYFKTDKQSAELYLKKVFDLAVDKIPFKLNDIEKKLYFVFVQRDISGLGVLANLLKDKNVLEISCAGEKTAISVYHSRYGVLESNILFDNISQLNQFVLAITKLMGLYVNSANPVFSGYLPNGYKIEGIYSAGDISSKGSSFIIKKYLEEPLTLVSLIDTGTGSSDVYAYIWSAIMQGYKIVLGGRDDSFVLLNSLALLLPDKKIVSVQSHDCLKLPQKNWIRRMAGVVTKSVDKKALLSQTISERPDYIILDEFGDSLQDISWQSIDMFTVDNSKLAGILGTAEQENLNVLLVEVQRVSVGRRQNTQITKITEVAGKKEAIAVELDNDGQNYHINLLSSGVDIAEFNRKKKIIRWMMDAKLVDYRDFNSVANEYVCDKDSLIKKLNIDIS